MKWKNVPVPETIVIPLLIGIAAQYFFPNQMFKSTVITGILGVLFLVAGVILIVWSVREVGSMDMTSPGEFISTGPYSRSRNPMYLGWILIFISVMLLTNSLWILLLLPVAVLLTHFIAILPEERKLELEFGEQFARYCEKVRRYI